MTTVQSKENGVGAKGARPDTSDSDLGQLSTPCIVDREITDKGSRRSRSPSASERIDRCLKIVNQALVSKADTAIKPTNPFSPRGKDAYLLAERFDEIYGGVESDLRTLKQQLDRIAKGDSSTAKRVETIKKTLISLHENGVKLKDSQYREVVAPGNKRLVEQVLNAIEHLTVNGNQVGQALASLEVEQAKSRVEAVERAASLSRKQRLSGVEVDTSSLDSIRVSLEQRRGKEIEKQLTPYYQVKEACEKVDLLSAKLERVSSLVGYIKEAGFTGTLKNLFTLGRARKNLATELGEELSALQADKGNRTYLKRTVLAVRSRIVQHFSGYVFTADASTPAPLKLASVPLAKADKDLSRENLLKELKLLEGAKLAVNFISKTPLRVELKKAGASLLIEQSRPGMSKIYRRNGTGQIELLGKAWNDDALKIAAKFAAADAEKLKLKKKVYTERIVADPEDRAMAEGRLVSKWR